MRLLIDMNRTPLWVDFFGSHKLESVHWSTIGDPRALDPEIMDFARENSFVVFTHDLDFGTILAATRARGPSVIQARVEDPVPDTIGEIVVAIAENVAHLEQGVLLTIEPDRFRIRILPVAPA